MAVIARWPLVEFDSSLSFDSRIDRLIGSVNFKVKRETDFCSPSSRTEVFLRVP